MGLELILVPSRQSQRVQTLGLTSMKSTCRSEPFQLWPPFTESHLALIQKDGHSLVSGRLTDWCVALPKMLFRFGLVCRSIFEIQCRRRIIFNVQDVGTDYAHSTWLSRYANHSNSYRVPFRPDSRGNEREMKQQGTGIPKRNMHLLCYLALECTLQECFRLAADTTFNP
jgi:hypothetical protein